MIDVRVGLQNFRDGEFVIARFLEQAGGISAGIDDCTVPCFRAAHDIDVGLKGAHGKRFDDDFRLICHNALLTIIL